MAFLTSAPPSITSYKTPAKVASTASLALSGVIGSIQIDSIALSSLSTGDRILLKNQGTGSENGIYELTVSGLNYSLARSLDANTSAKLSPNSLVPVSQGTVNADNVFQLTNNSVNLGTDSLVFVAVDSVALAGLAAEVTNRTNANLLDLKIASNLSDLASVGTAKTNLSLQNVDNTSDANKPVSTAQQTALNLKADLISPVFTTPNIGSATGSISGNAATVTTNANLTGPVTSVGNATAIANSAISNAMLANAAVANLSGTNTGDNAATSLVPSQASQANKVLATDGTASSWQYAGLGAGSFGATQIFLGQAKPTSASGADVTIIGRTSGPSITTAPNMILIGSSVLPTGTGGYGGIISLGTSGNSLTGSSTGSNIAIGFGGSFGDANAQYSTLIGGSTCGNNSTVVGFLGRADGAYSVAIGVSSGTGNSGVAIGCESDSYGQNETIVIGRRASNRNTQGIVIGAFAGAVWQNGVGPQNTIVGAYAGGRQNDVGATKNVFLGYYAGGRNTNQGNELFIDNQDRTTYANQQTKSLLYGVFNATASSQTLAINAAVSMPYTLAVTGVATFTAAPIVSSVTASQILASGASKEVVSLSTATYPSLAELAYVKGVTSAVQTQLNSEATARAAAVLLAVPAQSGNTEKVLATNGSSTYWAIGGIKTGYPTGSTILGRLKPASISGTYNTLIGDSAGSAMTTAFETVAIGHLALSQNTTGSENNAIGGHALEANTTGYSNLAFGLYTLQSNISGYQNIGIGSYALNHSTGNANIGIGLAALYTNTSGSSNVAVGTNALRLSTTASNNVAVGYQALYNNTTGFYNVASGSNALLTNTTGSDNIAMGASVLQQNTIGTENIGIGSSALQNNTTATKNVFIGSGAGYSLTTGGSNNGMGWFALRNATTGNENTALGNYSLANLTTGSNSVAVGGTTLSSTTTGVNNVAVGWHALTTNVIGNSNVALGFAAGRNNAGSYNTFIGTDVNNNWSTATSTGDYNTITGFTSFSVNTSGAANSAFGAYNLVANTTGENNSVLGCVSLYANTTGNHNVAIGREVLYVNITGSESIAIGHFALQNNITGSNNVAIGSNAGRYATAGNEFYLNNQDRTDTAGDKAKSLMYGVFNATASSQTLAINAAVSIPNNLSITAAGYGLKIKEGSDARMGVATLVLGTVTVTNNTVTANTRIMLTAQNNGGTIGFLSISARTASTSFTILSSSALDTSDVAWMLVEPA